MIDLHLHTTASDGRCTPRELVRQALAAGIHTLAVTDHDTMSGIPDAADEAKALGVGFVPGIEVTSVHDGKDVHVLAYGITGEARELHELLGAQRARRMRRAREIGDRLATMGAPIDVEALIATCSQRGGKALARPQIADQLVKAGHAASVADAFDRFVGEQCPAYVPHEGASPAEVVSVIVTCGGVASLAHPGQLNRDELIPALVDAGMTCLEVFHSAHDQETEERYLRLSENYGLYATGGSDYHGEGTRRSECFGIVGLPEAAFDRFMAHLAEQQRTWQACGTKGGVTRTLKGPEGPKTPKELS